MNELTTAQAARVLETSPRMVQYFVRTGRLTTSRRIGRQLLFDPIVVEAFKPNMVRRNWAHQLASASADAGHLDVDRALMILGAFALGVVAALSPLAVTVYVALLAVCAFAASWLVVHELRDRGRLRDPHRDRVLADPADLPRAAAWPRVEVRDLDHIVVPGPFSRAGIRK